MHDSGEYRILIEELENLASILKGEGRRDDVKVIVSALSVIKRQSDTIKKVVSIIPDDGLKIARERARIGINDLTQEEATTLFSYDDESGDISWKIHKKKYLVGEVASTVSNRGYKLVFVNGKYRHVHRTIWIMHNGTIQPGLEIDHIDGNPSNNLLENLRVVNRIEQAKNMATPSSNTSGHIGVRRYNGDTRYWEATIGGKRIGIFGSESEAIAQRKRAEELHKYHKNHGRKKK